MDGFFMRKYGRRIGICLLITAIFWTSGLIRDRNLLKKELVRLHVVGASDSAQDQAVKLRVRDAVLESIGKEIANLADGDAAVEYLREQLPKIESAANEALAAAGFSDRVRVSLNMEAFPTRLYETFALPSGVYRTLRIVIGSGEGQNWWCVAFPGLCVGATVDDFEEAASCAGFSDELTQTLETKDTYEIRFFLLDLLGRIENLLFEG